MQSEKVSLLHDAEKFFFIDLTVAIPVGLIDHFLKLLICHPFSKLFCHAFQVLEGYFARLVIIKQTESFQDLILGVAIENLMSHHLEKFFVLDGSTSIIIDVRNHLLNLLLFWLKAESAHGNFQLL